MMDFNTYSHEGHLKQYDKPRGNIKQDSNKKKAIWLLKHLISLIYLKHMI
jgi:hypothetical protein